MRQMERIGHFGTRFRTWHTECGIIGHQSRQGWIAKLNKVIALCRNRAVIVANQRLDLVLHVELGFFSRFKNLSLHLLRNQTIEHSGQLILKRKLDRIGQSSDNGVSWWQNSNFMVKLESGYFLDSFRRCISRCASRVDIRLKIWSVKSRGSTGLDNLFITCEGDFKWLWRVK